MARGKHESRSFHFGINPEEVADDDGYATKSPTGSSITATSSAASPAIRTAFLSRSRGPTSQDLMVAFAKLQQEIQYRRSENLSWHAHPGAALRSDQSPDYNPVEGLWRVFSRANALVGSSIANQASREGLNDIDRPCRASKKAGKMVFSLLRDGRASRKTNRGRCGGLSY